ncbi:hypothetical protein, partial [Clostridium fessum]|uniref:hypothetical protein n=1 Tax=Clostridium fessum TaxID=2126740 RepID=UPI0039931260
LAGGDGAREAVSGDGAGAVAEVTELLFKFTLNYLKKVMLQIIILSIIIIPSIIIHSIIFL